MNSEILLFNVTQAFDSWEIEDISNKSLNHAVNHANHAIISYSNYYIFLGLI